MCTTGRVYKVYKAWCKDNNNGYAKTAREFRETLGAHLGTTFAEMTVRYGKGATSTRTSPSPIPQRVNTPWSTGMMILSSSLVNPVNVQ